mgnify:CR=1 FL=1
MIDLFATSVRDAQISRSKKPTGAASGAGSVRVAITVEQLEKRVAALSNMPTLPGVIRSVGLLVEDQDSSASDIAEIISKDPVLSSRILRLVNSPVYGFPSRIASVTHALVLLGFNVVKGLVLGTAVFDTFAKQTVGLWEHSLGCAIVSRRIARELALPDVEEIMIAGLLHDFGKAILSFVAKAEYDIALKTAQLKGCHIAAGEMEVLGTDHTSVAGWVTQQWRLPACLRDPIVHHHEPALSKTHPTAAAIVHLADILARGLGYGWPGDMTMPPIDHVAFQGLGLSLDQIDHILAMAELEYAGGVDIFGADTTN